MPKALTPAELPKACPGCGKTTIKTYRHDITPMVDDVGAEPIAWQCVYCGLVFSRNGASGKLVPECYQQIILAPGALSSLESYQSRRNKAKG